MRIVIFTNLIPPLWVGGYEIGAARVVQALKAQGHKVVVFSAHEMVKQQEKHWHFQSHTSCSKAELVDVGPCLLGSLVRFGMRSPWRLSGLLLAYLASRNRLPNVLDQFKPDLILLFNPLGILPPIVKDFLRWGRKHRVPVRSYISDPWLAHWPEANPVYRLMRKMNISFEKPRSDRDIYCSQYLHDFSQGRPQDRVVPWGLSDIPSSPLEESQFAGPEPLKLLYAGQIEPHKGLSQLLEAMSRCRNPHRLVVLGDEKTPHAEACQEQARKLGIGDLVHLVGRQSPCSMPHLLRQLGQVLVVPSVWPEPLSLTMLEGMAAGLPVIASRTGGTPEAIQDNHNGLLFDTGDINQLTKAIDTLDGDRPLAHKLGCRAWETIRNQHSMEKMIMGLLEPSSASVKTGSASGKQENTDAYRVQSFAYSW